MFHDGQKGGSPHSLRSASLKDCKNENYLTYSQKLKAKLFVVFLKNAITSKI